MNAHEATRQSNARAAFLTSANYYIHTWSLSRFAGDRPFREFWLGHLRNSVVPTVLIVMYCLWTANFRTASHAIEWFVAWPITLLLLLLVLAVASAQLTLLWTRSPKLTTMEIVSLLLIVLGLPAGVVLLNKPV